jgi:very-short-patch-repair endonuclease
MRREQLIAAGLTASQIKVRIERRQIRTVHCGVYTVNYGNEPKMFRETAALLACGGQVALSHASALQAWGVLAAGVGEPVDITVFRGGSRNQLGIRVHRSRTLTRAQVRTVAGLPVTVPERALLDSAPLLAPRQLERALDEALARRLTSFTKVKEMAASHRGHPGYGRLAALVETRRFSTATESEAEERFLALMREAGLPTPQTQVEMHGFRVDVYWPQARLAVEIDGLQWHNRTKKSFERDRRKQQVLQDHEIEVARTTWEQITEERLQLVAHISRRLAQRTIVASL